MEIYDKIPAGRKQKQEMRNKRFGCLKKVVENIRKNHVPGVLPVQRTLPRKKINSLKKDDIPPKIRSQNRQKKLIEQNKKKKN